MNRIDRVSEKIKEISSKVKKEDILSHRDVGYSATYIADLVGSQRNNITTDLNNLFKEGKLIKIIGKPMLFFDREVFEKAFNIKLKEGNLCCKSLDEFIDTENKYKEEKPNGAFESIIGNDGSLSVAIKQAKAAILYPPSGLHSMILGDTGVGKSTFAEAMYKYGKEKGIFRDDSPFIVFNCSDYANNPQLLISQLFGYNKGSYTGAEKDNKGLLELADGGVLFLDEVHRLTPEGQEMLFTFIDKGFYRRMGEVKNERTARVLIITATTENPESSLLRTFLRRIPMVIKLPPLKERRLNERLALIKSFFKMEAKRLGHNIIVDKEAFEALLTYNPLGNIGQLKSDVQLSSARAFLEFNIEKLEDVYVTINFVPEYVKKGLLNLNKEIRSDLDKMLVDSQYNFSSRHSAGITLEAPKYDFIKYYYETIKQNLDSEINTQKAFESFTRIVTQRMYTNSMFSDLIDDDSLDMVKLIYDIVYNELGIILDKSICYSLALHFIYISRYDLRDIDCMSIPVNEEIKIKYSSVYRTSINIIKILERDFGICCPNYEAYFLTVVINSFKENKTLNHVGVLVIAHGNETASSIASVANELLAVNHVNAINMSLDEKPNDILNRAVEVVREIDNGKGVLILVDMGSLATFGTVIKDRTGIDVRVLDNVSTLTVVEAARKALMPNSDLDYITRSLINMNLTLNERLKRRIDEEYNKNIKRIIYTVCASGQGTAFYLEKNIRDILTENHIFNVQVIPLSLANKMQFREIISDSAKDKSIVAVVGSIDPMMEDYPFISLQDIVINNGLKKLLKLVSPELSINSNEGCILEKNREIVWRATTEVVEKYLQFLSSDKVLPCIRECITILENCVGTNIKENIIVRAYIHIACMLERVLLKENQLTAGVDIPKYIRENEHLWISVKSSIKILEEIFSITISDDEVYFIVELLKDESVTNSIDTSI
jgi:Transcriptional regulators containing an AAA-type ATPase domain and a DNA-binding domain